MELLTRELTAALEAGDLEAADALQRRLSRLLGRFNSAMADTAAGSDTRAIGPTQREVIIGTVAAVGDATPTRVIRDIAAVDGTPIKSTGFPSIFRSDERSWRANPTRKPVLVLPGLESTTLAPMSSWVTLSSFEHSRRVITPLTPRAAHLRSLLYVTDRLAAAPPNGPITDAWSGLARRWASALPETRMFRSVDVEALRSGATDALAAIADAEKHDRELAAERAATASPDVALFGFRNLTVVDGGEEKAQ
jgi:hypothetical protein